MAAAMAHRTPITPIIFYICDNKKNTHDKVFYTNLMASSLFYKNHASIE